MISRLSLLSLALFVVTIACATELWGQDVNDRGVDFFEAKIRPILVNRCYECHSEESGKRKGGLWLDRKTGWQEGGDSGEAIVPGNIEDSLFIHSIRYEDLSLQMPPKGRLPNDEIAILEKWIASGAADPRNLAIDGTVREGGIDYESARQYWAFRPLAEQEIPHIKNGNDAKSDIDRFILGRLQAEGLSPAESASPRHLLRRLFYDLTGLPPTRDDVADFVDEPSEEAYTRLVDDLLSRSSFGEKWGKHWLDVARYADSNGGDRNFTFHQAWRYRNYVIDALNSDKPYYEFVREQIAGDLLSAENDAQRREQLIGSTFLSLGPKMLTERDKEKLWLDTVDEQIDTTGRAFLGLTFGCARCHDHKFDPISQNDYYALAGIFRSTEVVTGTQNGCVNVASWVEQPLPGMASEQLVKKVQRLELAMRLTVEKVYNDKSGNQSGGRQLPLAGVITDNTQAELIGKWRQSKLQANRYGDDYVVSEGNDDKAIFRVSLPETGTYHVRVAYSADPSRCRHVPIVVQNHEGEHRLNADESLQPSVAGLFQSIGVFEFEKDNTCQVTFECKGTKGYVIVDAVQLISVDDIAREEIAIAAKGNEIDPIYTMSSGALKKEISRLLNELRTEDLAMAPRDVATPADCNLRIRGEVAQLGPKVRRGFPAVLTDGKQISLAAGASGRRELADWLVRPENSLLDRVIVNRIWHHLFDRGIVSTVDNFGRLGETPTHPKLLDYLAKRFRDSSGSIKSLVRDIVLSQAYRMSCDHDHTAADPANQLFSRQNRRRLSAEEIRDSVLFLSGDLDQSIAEATAVSFGVDLDTPMSFEKNPIRTVYLPVARNNAVAEMALFDSANPDLVEGDRPETTVPTQALYLLNSEFVQSKAAQMTARLPTDAAVEWLYETILARSPTEWEINRANAFIAELAGAQPDRKTLQAAQGQFAHLLLASTEFLFLD